METGDGGMAVSNDRLDVLDIIVVGLGVFELALGLGFFAWASLSQMDAAIRIIVFIVASVAVAAGILFISISAREMIMRLGVVERIREKRRIAAAAATFEKYLGVDLLNSPEAAELPVPMYRCRSENCSYGSVARHPASSLHWVDTQPLLENGWYCEECVDKLSDKPKADRLNMEIFLLMLDGDIG